ncbi:MAG TPA: formyltransferase [Burkholderiales bacterium]|nr:formyltransferase [Burkholderiales bacterium]
MNRRPTAVVFAYHNVGVQCLSVLLAHKVDVPLVVTHNDNPAEKIWFDSVASLAAEHGLPTITPDDPNRAELVASMRALEPDFLFSFYYRYLLKPPLLAIAKQGALNMHGSLLPKYRGRVPVNWAVINGETETGATLHYMTEKPDAGDIVDQHAVPIGPEDTAFDVFHRVTEAAAIVLTRALPRLVAGTAPRKPQNLALGSYFGARRPEDGSIDWRLSATRIHNLVRGVAPPYPGAYTELGGSTLRILRTRVEPAQTASGRAPGLYVDAQGSFALCADGGQLRILEMELDGAPFTTASFLARFGSKPIPLEDLRAFGPGKGAVSYASEYALIKKNI